MFNKTCSICKKEFETKHECQNICSFVCRREAQRERSRIAMRRNRNKYRKFFPPCEVCSYSKITEPHHEPDGIHYLCPTHHCLITRNYTTLKDMKNNLKDW